MTSRTARSASVLSIASVILFGMASFHGMTVAKAATGGGMVQSTSESKLRFLATKKQYPNLSDSQVTHRIAIESGQTSLANKLAGMRGVDGVYLNNLGYATALTKTSTAHSEVQHAGGIAVSASRGESDLDAIQAEVVRIVAESNDEGTFISSNPDLVSQLVEVQLSNMSTPLADSLKSIPGVSLATSANVWTEAKSSIGGWMTYYSGGFNCTSGFNAISAWGASARRTVMITAGHCTRPLGMSATVGGQSGTTIGHTISSHYKSGGTDVGLVDFDSDVSTPARIDNRSGGYIDVGGSSISYVGSTICKYGFATNRTCGVVTARGATINLSGDIVGHMSLTNAKDDHGDSGGPVMVGTYYATGTISGVDSNKNMSFTEIAEELSEYGATLKTY